MFAPPCSLVTGLVKPAMVGPAEQPGEFVGDRAAQSTRLGKASVMRIRRFAAANQA